MREFAVPATYEPSRVGGSYVVRGVFRSSYVSIDPDTNAAVQINKPVLGVKYSELPIVPEEGDRFTVNGVRYQIERREDDGEGGGQLFLRKAAS
jgi:hypothetical protein